LVPVVAASTVVGVVGVNGPFDSLTNDKEEMPIDVASVPGADDFALLECTTVGGSPTSDVSPPLPLSDIIYPRNNTVGRIISTYY